MKCDYIEENSYKLDEIYDGISRGRLKKNSKGWNIWLGILFVLLIYIWIVIYSSKILILIEKLENNDNLMDEIKFDEQISLFGYNINELSLSILTFCIQESDPTLVNIPVRLSLSNQIVKQRYLVRNSIDELNKRELPRNRKNKKEIIEKMIENTVTLLKTLVPLNIGLEEQPSPISPAPPPYYEPQRTNITEEELLNSIESDSNTFLAAKYLCNNTDYIAELSNYLKFSAFNISNPSKLFDLNYLNDFALNNNILNYNLMNNMMIFHYIITTVILILILIIFYFGSMDYFQRNKRIKMMNISKMQIDELLNYVAKIDNINYRLINENFLFVSKIYKYIEIICNNIIKENENNLSNYLKSKIIEISEVTSEFQKCVNITLLYSNIINKEINKKYEIKNDYVSLSEIIEFEIFNSEDIGKNMKWRNNHYFSDNIENTLNLYGNSEEFNNMLNSMLKTLETKCDKHIFWDIVNINDNSLIPLSMMNSLGELNTCIKDSIEINWNYSVIDNNEKKSFLTIDMINMNIDKICENRNEPLFRLKNLTRNFHYLITKRMVDSIFGGIIITHKDSIQNYLQDENLEMDYDKNMIGNTLIIPIKNQISCNNEKNNHYTITLFSCGLDQNYSNIIKSLSKIINFHYIIVDYWELIDQENIFNYLKNKSGFWLIDTSILNIIEDKSEYIKNLNKQNYYIKNDIDIILICTIQKIEVVCEYDHGTNLNQFYYSLKSHFSDFQSQKIDKKHQEKILEKNFNYKEIIKLFDKPISEISPDLFNNIENLYKRSDNNSLINYHLISLVNIEELLIQQINQTTELKNDESNHIDFKKPEILNNEWYNIDILELSIDEVINIAEYLIFYRYDLLIKDNHIYDEDVTLWPINREKIKNFVFEIQRHYHKNNPFHNFHHVVSVSITLNQWLDKNSVKEYINSLEAYCLIISSLGHDLDHPGLSNDFIMDLQEISNNIIYEFNQYQQQIEYIQNNVISTLGIYNGISILENHHISLLFVLLNKHSCNIMPPINSAYFEYSKNIITNSILYTDMFYHKYLTNSIQYFNISFQNNKKNSRIFAIKKKLYMSILLHSADISNPLLNINIYFKWSKLIFREFSNQNKIKEILNINHDQISLIDDFVNSQVGFINVICLSYFQLLNQFDPSILDDSIQNLYYNDDYFKQLQKKNKTIVHAN